MKKGAPTSAVMMPTRISTGGARLRASVSAGGATGAVIAMALGLNRLFPMALPCFAFVGALGAVVLVYSIALVRGRLSISALLLAGIAVTSFLAAVISLVIALVPSDAAVREIVFWLAGGLDAASWQQVWLTAPFLTLGTIVIVVLARDVNLLMQGDDEALSQIASRPVHPTGVGDPVGIDLAHRGIGKPVAEKRSLVERHTTSPRPF